jgi:hypothetical protein
VRLLILNVRMSLDISLQTLRIACNPASGRQESNQNRRHPARYGEIGVYSKIEGNSVSNGRGPGTGERENPSLGCGNEIP